MEIIAKDSETGEVTTNHLATANTKKWIHEEVENCMLRAGYPIERKAEDVKADFAFVAKIRKRAERGESQIQGNLIRAVFTALIFVGGILYNKFVGK